MSRRRVVAIHYDFGSSKHVSRHQLRYIDQYFDMETMMFMADMVNAFALHGKDSSSRTCAAHFEH